MAVACSPGHRDFVYRFHRLAGGARGGGAELHLTFDGEGRCEEARWRHTQ